MLVVWGGVEWQQGAGLDTEKARNAGGYGIAPGTGLETRLNWRY